MNVNDIRPDHLLNRYLELCSRDCYKSFSDSQRRDLPCVACGSPDASSFSTKDGFSYLRCNSCKSVYQSPRPDRESFNKFYRDSDSSLYWSDVFFPAVSEKRRNLIFKPRAERFLSLAREHSIELSKVIEVGSGYGLFLEEFRRLFPESDCYCIEPSHSLANKCRSLNFNVIEDTLENVDKMKINADIAVCFEVFEHVYDPKEFISCLINLVKPRGHILISTLTIDGFDLSILGKESSQINPPHHINICSIAGIVELFRQLGLNDINVFTPGLLDTQIVRDYYLNMDPDIEHSPADAFLTRLLSRTDTAQAFQEFLISHNLSSHVWILAKT